MPILFTSVHLRARAGRRYAQLAFPPVMLALCALMLTFYPSVICAQTDSHTEIAFDFETGDLQGWRVIEGEFGWLVCNRPHFHIQATVPYNKQGEYFLTTLDTAEGESNDPFTGVIESPVFVLSEGKISFRIGGGSHDDTYVALCTLDGEELFKASGKNREKMEAVTWDARDHVGRPLFLRVADRNPGGWGHITCDNFQLNATIDEAASRTHFARRQRDVRERRLREKRETLLTGIQTTRPAIVDLMETFGQGYPNGSAHLTELDALERASVDGDLESFGKLESDLENLRRRALTENPLVSGQPLLYVVRAQYLPDHHNTATLFQNGEINTGSFRGGGALKSIHFGEEGRTETLIKLPDGLVRDPEVSFDGKRVLFSMRRNKADDYHIYEVGVDGSSLRQLTSGSELSDFDPLYLPSGEILLVSTRDYKLCQCNRHIMGNLFIMDADGGGLHQVGRNTLFEGHPSLLPDGRILYDRWEYVDKHFGPAMGLWTVNPDGTNHAVYYGNNAWSPGAIVDARIIPGTERFVATFGSCHDRPWGAFAVADRRIGMDGADPVVFSRPENIASYLTNRRDYQVGLNRNGHPMGGQIDNFVRLPVKYEDPYPLSDKHFLASRTIEGERMGIFLLDVFGNEILLHDEGPGCFDPMPIAPRERPPVIAPKNNLAKSEGAYYVADVYAGTGMTNVERGTVKTLRVVEAPAKTFWTQTNWNIDATQAPAMNWNSTNNKRILGTVPVEPDGSAYFTVPSDTFLFFQLLDEDGMMVQSMRSGTMLAAGETSGCVGCHDHRLTTVPNRKRPAAFSRLPRRLEPWYGPPRDFNYLTEVQPVFDRQCVSCHDYGRPAGEVLNLSGDMGLAFNTSYSELRIKSPVRWHRDAPAAPKPLVKAVDDGPPEALPAYAWGSHRSRLVDVMRSGHHDVQLDRESLDRVVTWIDLNAPYYGSYASVYRDNVFGRSPLNDAELAELRELTDVAVGEQRSEMQVSQVSFDRPELSPCLAGLEREDPRYAKAVAIIETGRTRLEALPRMDMSNAQLVGIDIERQAKAEARERVEALVREALTHRE